MSKHRDPFPHQGRTLGRYARNSIATEDRAKITRILVAVGEPVELKGGHATAGGDERKLRGIPAIGRGVTGAIPNTRPEDCIR